jgi:hypothetical protein
MTEPRSSARDSSLWDRKAPEVWLLRTRQPRFGNVVRCEGQRHLGRAARGSFSPLAGRRLG